MERYKNLSDEAATRVNRALRLTWAGMFVERFLWAFWPFLTVLALALAWMFSGLSASASLNVMRIVAVVIGIMGLASLVYGFLRYRAPSRTEALARLDASLPGAPIATLSDAQAIGTNDAASRAVWEAHLARMTAKLDAARAQPARPNLAPRDPFALRLMALTALLVAVVFGVRAVGPGLSGLMPGTGEDIAQASWEGWVEPPSYTGKPTLYLGDQEPGVLEVPEGSRITLRLYGRIDQTDIAESWSDTAPSEPLPTRLFTVDEDGTLTINEETWEIAAIDDADPTIEITGDLTRNIAGEMRQGFAATDDYGVSTGQARVSLNLSDVNRSFGLAADPEPRKDIIVDLPMPFRGSREEVEEILVENFSEHPWAEMPVTVTLTAVDAAGQTGESVPVTITLPGRRFLNPIARAIIEQRRDILWTTDNAAPTARILRAISNRPEGFFPKDVQAQMLRASLGPMEEEEFNPAVRDEVAQALWDLAIQIEEGALNDALERLRRAEERVQEAMRQGATPEELSELMDEMRQAMQDYMQQLAEQAEPQDGTDQPDQGEQMTMTQQDLQEMMDRIEELMREGRTEEAAEMLRQLQQMMENMQMTQGQGGEGQQSPGQQAMRGLQDTLREQRDLSDETFQQQQGDQQGQQGQGQQQQGQNGEGQEQGEQGQGQDGQQQGQGQGRDGDLNQRQRQLQNELNRQRNNLPGAGTEEGDAARDALDRAGRAMDDAAEALDEGDTSRALDRQAEAMENMREGMRNLEDAMRQEAQNQDQQQGGQGSQRGGPDGREQRDPLGREAGDRGALGSDSPLADGEDVYRRAEELMEELRRRSGEAERPQVERDYLERLLDLF